MELTEIQKEISQNDSKKLVVMASPGSGKSTTAAARVRYLIDRGESPSDIFIISFTNAAAISIADKVKGSGVFAGTFHSLCASILSRNGVKITSAIESQQFDELFEMIKENPKIVPTGKIFICDESQDFSDNEYSLLFDYFKPREFTLFGDMRQVVYAFKGIEIDTLMRVAEEQGATIVGLNQNFRNAIQITDTARKLLSKTRFSEDSILMRKEFGVVCKREFDFSILKDIIEQNKEYLRDTFVLCRTNKRVNECARLLSNYGYPVTNFSSIGSSDKEFEDGMEADTIKVLTTFKAKGLEAKIVIVVEPTFYNEEELLVTYVAYTRARDKLYILTQAPKRQKKRNSDWY